MRAPSSPDQIAEEPEKSRFQEVGTGAALKLAQVE
jgi:hypothetical protein